jgi:hypothetical protein
VGGVPILIYDLFVTHFDETLSSWNEQNLTLTFPFWNILISMSPLLPVAVITFWWVLVRNDERSQGYHNLLLWAGLGIVLIYLPFSLQRRFMMGLYVPFVGSAVSGLNIIVGNDRNRFRRISILLFLLALPTNLVILIALHHGIQTHDEMIYLRRDEVDALMWISQNTPSEGLILASPEMGLFIPAQTGRRVIYGHPFETTNAKIEKHSVRRFFQGDILPSEAKSYLIKRGVNYIFFGPRESELGNMPSLDIVKPVFENETVVVMKVEK